MNREIFEAVDYAMGKSSGNHRNLLDTLIVARNLERVADHATNIAEDVIFWIQGADVRHKGSVDAANAAKAAEAGIQAS